MRKILIIASIFLISFFIFLLLSPLWIEPLILHLLEKNLGGKIKIDKVTFIFPNKIYASNLNWENRFILANVALSIENILKLSPINLELIKPKIIITHNEKGEWVFPSIPGLTGGGNSQGVNINVEVKAKIKDGIVLVRDLKTKKEIEISPVNGNFAYKDQKITYTASYVSNIYKLGSNGTYDFSKNSGTLEFIFQDADAKDWALFFIPEFFNVNSGKFTGNLSVIGNGKDWYVKGVIDAKSVSASIKDLKLTLQDIETNIIIDKDLIEIKKGRGNWEGAMLYVVGKILPEFSLGININSLDLSKIDNLYLSNSMSLKGIGNGDLEIKGKFDSPNILGKISIKEGSIYKISFSNLELSSNSKYPNLNLGISFLLEQGKVMGNIEYNIDKNQGNIDLKGDNIPIENIGKLFNLQEIDGIANINIKGKGEKIWKFTVEGEIINGKVGEYSAEKVNLSVEGEWDLSNFFFQIK
jgi:hypothetical protein